MGVVFARFPEGDRIIGIARNSERNLEDGAAAETAGAGDEQGDDAAKTLAAATESTIKED